MEFVHLLGSQFVVTRAEIIFPISFPEREFNFAPALLTRSLWSGGATPPTRGSS